MQLITTSVAASQQVSSAFATAQSVNDSLARQTVEIVEAYLRRNTPVQASSYSPLPTTTGLFGKLRAFVR